MTQPTSAGATAAAFGSYAATMGSGETPVLGYVVFYNVTAEDVTREDLAAAFERLGLSMRHLPAELRQDDAFERVTGPSGVKATYLLSDPSLRTLPKRRQKEDVVTLMLRPATRGDGQIVRHLVREWRDERKAQLKYDTRLAVVTFDLDGERSKPGSGSMRIEPVPREIDKLAWGEQRRVRETIQEIKAGYARHCEYYTADRLRKIVRDYLERDLKALRISQTGGVYFVAASVVETLSALGELVGGFGSKSRLKSLPLPDDAENRQMIVEAFTTRARDDVQKLSLDAAELRRNGPTPAAAEALLRRFQAVREAAEGHSQLLSTTVQDTEDAMALLNRQLAALLTEAQAQATD